MQPIQIGDPVSFLEGPRTIRGVVKNIYKNICASVQSSMTNESHVVSLKDLKKTKTAKTGDSVRFHDRGKYYEGRVHNIVHGDVALVYADGEPFYIRLEDLIVI